MHATGQPHPAATSVLLRHELPGGDWHFDWMILGLGTEPGRPLLTFRTTTDPLAAPRSGFAALRTRDHRAHYLTHEGEIGSGRGRVDRVWRRTVGVMPEPHGFTVGFAESSVVLTGRIGRGPCWWFGPLD